MRNNKAHATQYLNKYDTLLHHIVHSYQRTTGQDFDDLLSAGYEGFLKACHKYDRGRGAKFITFAVICIKNSINEYLRKNTSKIEVLTEVEIEKISGAVTAEDKTLFQNRLQQLSREAQDILKILFALPDNNKPENRTELKKRCRTAGQSWPDIWRGMQELRTFCTRS